MRLATLSLLAAGLALAPAASAQCDAGDPQQQNFQQVTVRQINDISDANINTLNTASANGTLDVAQIQSLLTNDLEGTVVEFQAVILSDPILSGLANTTDGIPNRIHVFVRDVNALTDGNEGMGIQIVDSRGDGQIQQFFVGDEVVVCGRVSPFSGNGGKTMQIAPFSVTDAATAGTAVVDTQQEEDDILAPVVSTTEDFHNVVNGKTQIDWSVYEDYNGQYVRLENANIVQGIQGARPDVLLSSDPGGAQPQLNLYDTSVCFRNDRDDTYFGSNPVPACRTGDDPDFVPPPAGTANVQGFLTFQGDAGGFDYSDPGDANFVLSAFEDADFEVTEAPPTIAVDAVGTVPGPDDNVTVTATVVAAQGTVASATVNYRYVVDGSDVQTGTAALSNTSGDTWEGTIPARTEADANGAFVAYSITATDSEGFSTTTGEQSYRVVGGAINSIALIQETFDSGPGASPIATGAAVEFNLDAVVQSVYQSGSNYFATLQDDETLAPFTGIFVFLGSTDPGLTVGDRINITEATIQERFDVTQLSGLTYTTTSSGDPYPYKEVTTELLASASVAEQHEGMLLTFANAEITATNADDPSGPFGEFAFTTGGASSLRVDDLSNAITYDGNDPGTVYAVGDVLEYVRGPLYFSFGNYKLAPATADDLGPITTDVGTGPGESRIAIHGTYPNPAAQMARVEFELAVPGEASLRLFDVTGRQVATLATGMLTADVHTAELDVSGLAAGVYVLRLDAGNEVATRRLSVIR